MKSLDQFYVVVAGGTGGHLFPALSLAETLSRAGKRVGLFTDERAAALGSENKYVEQTWQWNFRRSGVWWKKPLFFLSLLGCFLFSLKLFCQRRPAAVVGFGCYVCGPVVLAAQLLRIRTIVHEQNAVLGRANRILAKRAKCVATGLPAVTGLTGCNTRFVGNPVRSKIAQLHAHIYTPPEKQGSIKVLILGGSQGSIFLAERLAQSLSLVSEPLRKRLQVCHQVPESMHDRVTQTYQRAGIEAHLSPFFRNMPALLPWAHVIVARAGASSLAEIAIAGLPSVLIPFAGSLDGDQLRNARVFEAAGAAKCFVETEAAATELALYLERLLLDPERLARMSEAARTLAIVDAAHQLARLVIEPEL